QTCLMEVQAMQIKYEPLESVLRKSRAAVVVDVISISMPQVEGYWQSIEFQATSTRALFGDGQPEQTLACRYSQGLPHRRGDMDVSPLVTGSGLEFRMKQGDRVIILLGGSEGESERITVLRIEPLSSAVTIQEHGMAHPRRPDKPS